MAVYKLAVIIKLSSNEDEFLVAKQTPPPMPAGEEYQKYVDSDLWDLPSAPLKPLEGECRSELVIEGADSCPEKIDLRLFDVDSALEQALSQVVLVAASNAHWELWKYAEEPEFGPGPSVHMIFVLGILKSEDINVQGLRWMRKERSLLRLSGRRIIGLGAKVFRRPLDLRIFVIVTLQIRGRDAKEVQEMERMWIQLTIDGPIVDGANLE